MDSDLKCNRLSCRKLLADKAVVTTCSHIFCVDCANELFNAARLCPACETSLTEPDDVVVCSLHPSNDYKTSVLSGLCPSTVLEICGRAISFWQYQIHQESSFQQAVLRNLNEKNAQLQKQLENVIREANGEINLLNGKVSGLERDIELERRRLRELQDISRERDKEYQKLKNQYDKIKRKALLAPSSMANEVLRGAENFVDRPATDDPMKIRNGGTLGYDGGGSINIGEIVGGMEANGIQRTPVTNRTMQVGIRTQQAPTWQRSNHAQVKPQRQPFARTDRLFRATSDQSGSADEVENLLGGHDLSAVTRPRNQNSWSSVPKSTYVQHNAIQSSNRRPGNAFRPAGLTTR